MPNFYQHNGTSYVHVSDYEALEVNALRELAAAQTAYVARGMELRDAEARLAEAEALLRKARRKILDIDGMTTSQFVDEGIGLSGLDLLKGIDAFLAPDSASVPHRPTCASYRYAQECDCGMTPDQPSSSASVPNRASDEAI